MKRRPAVCIRPLLLLLLCALFPSAPFANCTSSIMPVFQCGYVGWFAPPPEGSGAVSAVWWQLGYGNNLISNGENPAPSHEGTGIAPAGVFSGNDSGLSTTTATHPGGAGLPGITLTDARSVLPQYAAQIPGGALCSNYENSWAGVGVDGCADNPRTTSGGDNDNLLNPYWGAAYGPCAEPTADCDRYFTMNYQIDYPMAVLVRESTNRFFSLAFVASRARSWAGTARAADISENFFDLATVTNGELNPTTQGPGVGRNNIIPWQPVPKPRVDSIVPDGDQQIVALSWDNIRLVHDGSVRPSLRVVAGGVGVLDQLAQPGGLCRYQLQTAPATRANPDPSTLAWTNAGPVIPCPAGPGPVASSVTVSGSNAIRVRTLLGKTPRTTSTTIADVRLGSSGDLGFEATGCLSDACLQSPPLLVVGPAGDNQPPIVAAGPDRTVVLPASAVLDGTVSDDGLPAGSPLTTLWTKHSGPGTVIFADPQAVDTTAQFTASGDYVLRLTADDTDWTSSDTVTITVMTSTEANQVPVVEAGPDQAIAVSETALLSGSATDDGLPAGSVLSTSWSKESGPGTVNFGDPGALITTAHFSTIGSYVLRLTANDGEKAGSDSLTIQVGATLGNLPPVVDAGSNRTIIWPETATLDATVTDDGLPSPPALTFSWTRDSGPGIVTFGDPHAVDTTAQFSSPGAYVLRLTAGDGELIASDTMMVMVNAPPVNMPPVVDAGPNQTVTLPAAAMLDGTATDDGLPDGSVLTTLWSKESGPGTVTFGDASTVDTTAGFSSAGTYVLRLTASDSVWTTSDTVTISVQTTGPGFPFELRVARGTDDAEEKATGSVSVNSTDLEMVFDADVQTVGIRFDNIPIAQGDYVVRSWLQFTADEKQSEITELTIQAQAADSAPGFTTYRNSITTRPRTLASVTWTPAPWTVTLAAGPDQRTPDLSPLIQEVVDRAGWGSGHALVFLISGSGHRTARAFEGGASVAPLLHVELAAAGVNGAPQVDAGIDQTIRFPAGAALDATVMDDGLPSPPGTVRTRWSQVSGPGLAVFVDPNAVDTTVNFTLPGVYGLRLEADDGDLQTADEVTVTVLEALPSLVKIDVPISAGTDDGEEKPTGSISLTSTDLELVYDGANQTVGMRFASVPVPPGARIHGAWVQFVTDETQSEVTNLLIQGQADDNPVTFTTVRYDVSLRPRTIAWAAWAPAPWGILSEAGLAQQNTDPPAILQATMDRPGWMEGNAMVLIVTGTGHRTAKAYDGSIAKAPKLHIEFE